MKIRLNRTYIPIIWLLFLMAVAFNNDIYIYILLVVAGIMYIIYSVKMKVEFPSKINYCFMAMIMIYFVGLFNNTSITSVRSIISIVGIMLFFNATVAFSKEQYSAVFFASTFLALLFYLVFTKKNYNVENTISGVLIFMCVCVIYFVLKEWKKQRFGWIITGIFLLALILLTGYIVFNGRARTALFTGIIILTIFFVLEKINCKNKYTKKEFYILICGIGIFVAFYMMVSSFEWYNEVNQYSVKFFGKNIDSSRPTLWRAGFNELSYKIIIGLGTGVLPVEIGIPFDSFHNSFIQLLIQNGIVALILFMYILSEIWVELRGQIEDRSIRFILASFIGIIIYNCFETAFLNNKMIIGLLQWLILAIGYAKAKSIKSKRKEV